MDQLQLFRKRLLMIHEPEKVNEYTEEIGNCGIGFAHVFWPEFAVCRNLNKLQISVIYRQFKLQIPAAFTEI